MKTHSSLVAVGLVAALLASACDKAPTPTPAPAPAVHEHAPGEPAHDHEGDTHDGDPVVLHDAAFGPYSKVHVTFLRPRKTPVLELAFEIELTGPSSTVRGTARSASGALSLTGKADAEDEPGHYHLHIAELPADLDAGGAKVVLSFTPAGGEAVELELPLDA